jgi:hypothetical protein
MSKISKNNITVKPKGPQKGSQTVGAYNDRLGRGKSSTIGNKLNSQYFGDPRPLNETKQTKQMTPQKVKAMAKVMKAYPMGGAKNSVSSVVKSNRQARDMGKAISQGGKRNLKSVNK